MEIYAHRGSSATAPENTLRAFQEAIDAKADGVELDVHLSADGIPVVIHDENVDRTTNGSGSVHSFTVAQLHLLDAGQGEYVPTLAEVVTLLEGKLKLYIEIKAEGIVQAVLDVLKDFPNAEWLLGSFSHEVLRDARKADPDANLWLISFTAEDKDFAIIEEVGASGLSLFGLALSPEVVSRCKQASLKLATWTVNNPDDAYRCRDLDVQTLCTDAPADIIRALITMPGPAALHA